jgi:hypothetical protein
MTSLTAADGAREDPTLVPTADLAQDAETPPPARRWTNVVSSRTAALVALAALAAVLTSTWLAAHFVLDPHPGPHRIDVRVVDLPTGGRVALTLERSPDHPVPIAETVPDAWGRWDVEGDRAIAREVSRAFRYVGAVGEVAFLQFETGPDAGAVEILVDGRPFDEVDLNGAAGIRNVRLEFAPTWRGGAAIVWIGAVSVLAVLSYGVARRASVGLGRGRARLIAIAAVIPVGGLLVAVAELPAAPLTSYDISVRPLGAPSAPGASVAVAVRLTPPAGRHADTASFAAAADEWSVQSGWVTAASGTEAPLVWRGRASPDSRLDFLSPDGGGGRAEVIVNGERRVIDTSRPDGPGFTSHRLEDLGGDRNGAERAMRLALRLLDVLVVGGWAVVAGLAAAGLLRTPRPQPANFASAFARRSILIAGSWLVLLGLVWPGIATPDTLDMMYQVEDDRVSQAHPVVGSFMLHLLRHVVDGLGFVAIVQIALVAAACALVLAHLEMLRVPRLALALSTGLLVAWPGVWTVVISVWKDLPFAAGLIGLTFVGLRAARQGEGALAGRSDQALLLVSATMVWTMRFNGIPVVIAFVVALAWLTRRRWRRVAVVLTASVVVPVLLNVGLSSALDAGPNNSSASYATWHIANHLQAGTPVDEADRRFLEELGLPQQPPFDCQTINSSWYLSPEEYRANAPAHADRLRAIAIELDLRNPGATVDHLACASQLMWKINDTQLHTYVTSWYRDGDFLETIHPNDRAPTVEDVPAPRAAIVLYELVRDLPMWFFRPAIWFYGLLASAALVMLRTHKVRAGLPFLPGLATTVVLAPVNVSQDVRYLIGPTMIAMLLVPAACASRATAAVFLGGDDDAEEAPDDECPPGPSDGDAADRSDRRELDHSPVAVDP